MHGGDIIDDHKSIVDYRYGTTAGGTRENHWKWRLIDWLIDWLLHPPSLPTPTMSCMFVLCVCREGPIFLGSILASPGVPTSSGTPIGAGISLNAQIRCKSSYLQFPSPLPFVHLSLSCLFHLVVSFLPLHLVISLCHFVCFHIHFHFPVILGTVRQSIQLKESIGSLIDVSIGSLIDVSIDCIYLTHSHTNQCQQYDCQRCYATQQCQHPTWSIWHSGNDWLGCGWLRFDLNREDLTDWFHQSIYRFIHWLKPFVKWVWLLCVAAVCFCCKCLCLVSWTCANNNITQNMLTERFMMENKGRNGNNWHNNQ